MKQKESKYNFDIFKHIYKIQNRYNNRPTKKSCLLIPNEIFSKFVAFQT
ncbi:MAG: hypothetical protein V1781_01050 [Bacteroidota bacterium]